MAKATKQAQEAAKATKQAQEADGFGARLHYEEWLVQIKNTERGPEEEKLKLLRSNVKITEEQAAILNEGVLKGGNNQGKMYYLPE